MHTATRGTGRRRGRHDHAIAGLICDGLSSGWRSKIVGIAKVHKIKRGGKTWSLEFSISAEHGRLESVVLVSPNHWRPFRSRLTDSEYATLCETARALKKRGYRGEVRVVRDDFFVLRKLLSTLSAVRREMDAIDQFVSKPIKVAALR